MYTHMKMLYVCVYVCVYAYLCTSMLFVLIDLYTYVFAYSSGPYSAEVKMTHLLNSHWVAIINTNEHL